MMTVAGARLALVVVAIVTVRASTATTVIREPGRCVTYGYKGDSGDGLVNGINNTKAVAVLQPYPDIGSVCPSLANATALCCDAEQYLQLSQRLQQATAILNRCQACYQNFREFFCQYTCSPDQSMFKEVTNTVKTDAGSEVVQSVNFYVESGYAQTFFDSCRNIGFGATGEKLFDMLFHSAATPYEWFTVLGSDAEHGGYSSEYIQFPLPNQPAPSNFLPLSSSEKRVLTVPCNTSDPMLACSCSDCPSLCPSTDILNLNASSAPDSGRSWFLGVLCLPTLFFTLWVLFVSTLRLRFCRGRRAYRLQEGRRKIPFDRLGRVIGSHPLIISAACTCAVIILACVGLPRMELLTDPVKLWTPINSVSYQSMLRNQELFGPAFRVEQIIISTKTGVPLFQNDTTLDFVNKLRSIRSRLTSVITDDGIGFEDLCYRLAPSQPCLIQSVLGWFDTDGFAPSNPYERFKYCSNSNFEEDCFDRNGLPTLSNVALGGYPGSKSKSASATVLTILLEGVTDEQHLRQCEQWERKFIDLLQNSILEELFQYKVSYSTEQSLESELNSQTTQDAFSVILSYFIMFVYITFALGDCFPLRLMFRSTRAKLAFVAILIVIMSVMTSCAICGLAGIKATLIISEVIPFVILAIGVDNVFLMTKSFENQDSSLSRQERLAKMFADVGPSICLTALCEFGAFALGLLTTMPAVRAFACYAAVSVAVNLFLQLTCFSAALALSVPRQVRHRDDDDAAHYDPIQLFMEKLSPFITKRARVVCLLFCIAAILCMAPLVSMLELGLQPNVALPSQSYLQKYFKGVNDLLRVGPPMYMTVEADFSDQEVQNSLCTLKQCNPDSLGQIMNLAAQSPNSTYVASGTSNFIDDYLQWLNPPFLHSQDSLCCRWNLVRQQFCSPGDFDENCVPCIDEKGFDPEENMAVYEATGRPTSEAFSKFLPGFLSSNCSGSCIFCATPHYRNLRIVRSDNSTNVSAARFMAYHKILKTQRDFISALKSSRSLSTEVSRISIPTYSDSIFYVFFEQYLKIESIAALALILAILFVTVLLIFVFRDLSIAMATSATIIMILVDIVGIMALADININAISVVNLITCVGLSVEFCVPVIYRYIRTKSRAPSGMSAALSSTGSCVVRGILLTKICGLAVLFASATRMVRVYYASMYALICIVGAAHGLIFLPALVVLIDDWESHDSRKQPLLSQDARSPSLL